LIPLRKVKDCSVSKLVRGSLQAIITSNGYAEKESALPKNSA